MQQEFADYFMCMGLVVYQKLLCRYQLLEKSFGKFSHSMLVFNRLLFLFVRKRFYLFVEEENSCNLKVPNEINEKCVFH